MFSNLYYFIQNNTYNELLPDTYKYILNDIKNKYPTYINIHHIYYYIKNLDTNQIIDIYKNRYILEQNLLFNKIINKNCIYTKTQIYLLSK